MMRTAKDRFRDKHFKAERIPLQKLVVFQYDERNYGIPIEQVHRIVSESTPYTPHRQDYTLKTLDDKTITQVNLNILLSAHSQVHCDYLIICAFKDEEWLGLPIPQMPRILEVQVNQFEEIPSVYSEKALPPAVDKFIRYNDSELVFHLNLEDKLMCS